MIIDDGYKSETSIADIFNIMKLLILTPVGKYESVHNNFGNEL